MDIRKLQRAIVDGLEDVKAQDILVLNTEHLSSLFERVIIASGTSNRQTKALAAGVRAAVREAGFPVLATEGAGNGEWIIVDCGAAVAHIMQPAIREYYRLEEIWGGKTVKMKLGAAVKGLVKASEDMDEEEDDEPVVKVSVKTAAAKKVAVKRAPAKRAPAKKAAAKTAPVKLVSARKLPAKKVVAKQDMVKTTPASRAGGNAARAAAAALKLPPVKPVAVSRKKAVPTGPVSRTIVVPLPDRRTAAGKTAAGKTAPGKAPPRAKAAPLARLAATPGRKPAPAARKTVARADAKPAAKRAPRTPPKRG